MLVGISRNGRRISKFSELEQQKEMSGYEVNTVDDLESEKQNRCKSDKKRKTAL